MAYGSPAWFNGLSELYTALPVFIYTVNRFTEMLESIEGATFVRRAYVYQKEVAA